MTGTSQPIALACGRVVQVVPLLESVPLLRPIRHNRPLCDVYRRRLLLDNVGELMNDQERRIGFGVATW